MSNAIVGATGTGNTVTIMLFEASVQPSKSCSSSALIEYVTFEVVELVNEMPVEGVNVVQLELPGSW